jgi:chloramphenicol-sensitive protein RarD
VFFRERIDRWGALAIALAGAGVLIQMAAIGEPPWISLSLAVLFCTYGILRKRVDADAQTGLFVECLVLTLPGLLWVLWLQNTGQGAFGQSAAVTAVLLINGPATVAPFALFAWTARRLPLSTVGFIQFIGPTLTFGVGLAAGEPFTALYALAFAFIWAAVAVFAYGLWSRSRPARTAPVQTPV